jgi:hypothetical protein
MTQEKASNICISTYAVDRARLKALITHAKKKHPCPTPKSCNARTVISALLESKCIELNLIVEEC